MRPAAATLSKSAQPATAGRDDASRVEEFFQSLARAVRQFHTYPATSPRCIDAVEESHRALALIEVETLPCVVSPHELLVSGAAVGRGTPIEQELARRLYEARCQALEISFGIIADVVVDVRYWLNRVDLIASEIAADCRLREKQPA